MDLGLQGATAVVCGASSGMGLAVAEALAEEGARVVMFARRRDLLERQAERLGAVAVPGDLTVPADLERLVATTVETFGGIDILVLNGGGPPPGHARDLRPEEVAAAVELLLTPFVRLAGLALPHLERSGRGRIVLIESSSVREPIDGLVLSNAVRPGVVGWAKTLAREVARKGVTVNVIAPGSIDTERLAQLYAASEGSREEDAARIPVGRLGQPREVADLACFLASQRASYVTGAVIPVDGGLGRLLL